eukprot:PhF_6_TR25019/c0_g1_i1/m.34396
MLYELFVRGDTETVGCLDSKIPTLLYSTVTIAWVQGMKDTVTLNTGRILCVTTPRRPCALQATPFHLRSPPPTSRALPRTPRMPGTPPSFLPTALGRNHQNRRNDTYFMQKSQYS